MILWNHDLSEDGKHVSCLNFLFSGQTGIPFLLFFFLLIFRGWEDDLAMATGES